MKRKELKRDVGILVGRFQVPELHDAHKDLIQSVCSEHEKVIIFLGLSPVLVTRNNPLDFESRKQMILKEFPEVNVLYIKDERSDQVWSTKLDEQIKALVSPNQTVLLYGGRDSFINKYFGDFDTQELEQDRFISGSEIRKKISKKVKASPHFRSGVIWASYNQYPKVYTTVDIAVMEGDKLLLARKPNESEYRFIGGFADVGTEAFEEDARKEVKEEANIDIGELKYICSRRVEDWRYRSEIDKIKTIFFRADYVSGIPKASDDVCEVRWFKVDEIQETDMVKEHWKLFLKLKEDLKGEDDGQ